MPARMFAALAAALAIAAPEQPAQTSGQAPGLDLAAMDRSVVPGNDFFAYANGTWLKATPIPPDRAGWGVGAELAEATSKQVAELIQQASASASGGGSAKKLGDYYRTYLDTARIDALGLAPIRPRLARIDAVKSKAQLSAELGRELRADVDALNSTNFHTTNLFGLWVEQDLNDPKRYTPYLLQGGLGLPDRDYYLADTPRMAEIRTQYRAHLARVLTLMGARDAAGEADRVFALETDIARVHAPRAESEDVKKANNPWARTDFVKKAPGIDWTAFFWAAGLQAQSRFIVWHPKATAGEAALVAHAPLATWKTYLKVRAVEHVSSVLPKPFRDERFAFYSKVLAGTPEERARWKQAVDATNAAMGEAVGQLYVARYFPPESKAAVQAMVKDLLAAFRARIEHLSWMAPQTKAEALRKLETLKVGVGYPDHWIDYTALRVVDGDALGNLERAELFEYRRNLAKFGKPVDRGEWAMVPQEVNAVNLPVRNALNFPAAILQPPFFDPRNPTAMNFGGTGATIGHEISHSFDDQGALFDADGRLRNWWTPQDFAHFRASGQALAAQYSRYRPFPDLALNGEQVLSENIADLAGLNAAYDAYRMANGGREGPEMQGFGGDQQFFLAFAQSWREKAREAALRRQVITDGHAPAEYRAQTVRNLDPWYPAFKVEPGQTLYLAPEERVRIW